MRTILHLLGEIHDKRSNRGKRYELKSILALTLLGYTLGHTSLARIYRFGKSLNKTQKKKLGFKCGKTPSHPTITETIKKIDVDEFEKAISKITLESIDSEFKQIAIDGKSIRSTHGSTEGLLHLISAYSPEEKAVIAQVKSSLAGGEILGAKEALSRIDLKGKIVTGDAMFAQESLCKQITESKGNYLFKVKQNKKRILDDINQEFYLRKSKHLPILSFEGEISKAHGRIDQRRIEVIPIKDQSFAGSATIKQVARIHRKRYNLKTKKESVEVGYIMTSLSSKQINPSDLLNLSVKHWSIENHLHRTRDMNFKEDTCNIRSHRSQQNNSTIRNLAICLLNKVHTSITLAIEMISSNVNKALTMLCQRI